MNLTAVKCDGVLANDLVLPVYADVAFVPIVGFAMLLSPVGCNILLATFVIVIPPKSNRVFK